MATSLSIEVCKEHLQIWLDADRAISHGQSYTIGNRILTRVNATEVLNNIKYWNDQLSQATASSAGPRTFQIIPRG